MLFKKLYNWLKFKTLPSSVLFKNRLFIERDSKHRRIMSNFGLTFRNSKWSDYALTNVSLKSKDNFFKIIKNTLILTLLFLIVIKFSKYYSLDLINNEVLHVWWLVCDGGVYFFTFTLWSLFGLVQILVTNLKTQIFKTFYNIDINTTEFVKKNIDLTNEKKLIPNELKKSIFHNWLTTNSKNNTLTQNEKDLIIEKLFNETILNSNSNNNLKFFKNLYKISFYLTRNDINHTQLSDLINNSDDKTYTFLENTNFNSLLKLTLNLNSTNDSIKTSSTKFKSNNNKWNLFAFDNELNSYSNLILNKQGLFYLNNTNFNKLNQQFAQNIELLTINNALSDQLQTFKWNRWLYRYSILHRKLIENSHKITMSKKLISTGFYDSNLMTKNIWASDFFSKNLNNNDNIISTQFNSLYGDVYNLNNNLTKTTSELTNFNNSNTLSLLNFYEKSYFWYLKRFYLFNNLSTNQITSTFFKNTFKNTNQTLNKSLNIVSTQNTLNSLLLKSYSLTNVDFITSDYVNFNNLSTTNTVTNNFNKDLLNLKKEDDLLNLDNLEILNNLTGSLTFKKPTILFYKSDSYNTDVYKFLDFNLSNELNNNTKVSNNKITFSNLLNKSDIIFNKDLYLLMTLFSK